MILGNFSVWRESDIMYYISIFGIASIQDNQHYILYLLADQSDQSAKIVLDMFGQKSIELFISTKL